MPCAGIYGLSMMITRLTPIELERKLEAQRLGMPIPEDAPQPAASSAAPRKLDGGPLETVAADKPQEEHEYKGEFYPVDRHVVKKK